MKRGRPQSRWQECRDAVSEIAQEAVKYDTDGVDVHFLNHSANKTCKVAVLLLLLKFLEKLTVPHSQGMRWRAFLILSSFQVGTFADCPRGRG
jgi:hypothetical protein